jgi:hypothetical protein
VTPPWLPCAESSHPSGDRFCVVGCLGARYWIGDQGIMGAGDPGRALCHEQDRQAWPSWAHRSFGSDSVVGLLMKEVAAGESRIAPIRQGQQSVPVMIAAAVHVSDDAVGVDADGADPESRAAI